MDTYNMTAPAPRPPIFDTDDLLAFVEACEEVLPYFVSLSKVGLLEEGTDPDQAAADYIWGDGDFIARLNTGACIYCDGLVTDRTEVPEVSDDDAWARLAIEHSPSCEWIATRAHRGAYERE